MSACAQYKGTFAWHRPTVEGDSKTNSQHARYDHWIELAKKELPGVAQHNRERRA